MMIHLSAIDRLERNAHRVREMAGVLVRYGLADWLRQIPGSRLQEWLRDAEGHTIADLSTPERIRLALTELGTTFIKFGQMLSTRPDLVGQDLARELGRLQSGTPPDPPGAAQAIVYTELGHPPEALFAHFEAAPFASASIAQVHSARLQSGEEVVVKIQKEGIEARIEADLSILADLAALAEKHVTELKPYGLVAVVRQYTKTLRDELDFTRERRNLEEFRRNFAEDDTVHFPRPWPAFSSRRVLTMERLEGVHLDEFLARSPTQAERNAVAVKLIRAWYRMLFAGRLLYIDYHPGNLMILDDGRLELAVVRDDPDGGSLQLRRMDAGTRRSSCTSSDRNLADAGQMA
jgi:ubiquinone biosynthesis protein